MRSEMRQHFIFCLGLALVAWYAALFFAAIFSAFHTLRPPPDFIYRLYWESYFDEFGEKVFFLLLLTFSILLGFAIRKLFPFFTVGQTHRIYLLGAIVGVPLAGVGIFGVALAPDWPANAPPSHIAGGEFLWLVGALSIAMFFKRNRSPKI